MAKAKKKNEFFDGIMSGTTDIVQSLRGKKQLTIRKVSLPEAAKQMSPAEIVALRARKLKVSQAVFARLLNVSPQAVRNWEQGVNRPNGATLRLLQLTRSQPNILMRYLT